jgi:hypothetical protein
MREFMLARLAIWNCWQGGSRLNFEADFYTRKLTTPMSMREPFCANAKGICCRPDAEQT